MRYLKLTISLILSAIGLAVYFITIPQIDEDELVHLTVQAGDEAILENYYFDGYIYDYSSFTLNGDDVFTPANLPFLQQLDATDDMDMMLLKEDYSDFINELIFGPNILTYLISNGEDYLSSAHFEYQSGTYSEIYSALTIRTLNKETNKIEEDVVTRETRSNVYYASIVGIYENYPVVDVLVDTRIGDPTNEFNETTELSLISYNFETKNMTESVVLDTKEYLEPQRYASVYSNQSIMAFSAFDSETSAEKSYLMDFEKNTMVQREGPRERLVVSDDSRLYSIEETTLVAYSEMHTERVREVSLSMDFAEKKNMDFSMNELFILDSKLFVVNNNDTTDETQRDNIKPTDLVVYDITTGEILVEGQFNFDGTEQVDAWATSIDLIKETPTKD